MFQLTWMGVTGAGFASVLVCSWLWVWSRGRGSQPPGDLGSISETWLKKGAKAWATWKVEEFRRRLVEPT